MAYYCRSLSRFPSHEVTRIIASPPGWDASPSQVTSQYFVRYMYPWQFNGTHLYSWVERGTVRVKCLAQGHNTMTHPGLEPGPLDPESSMPTTNSFSHRLTCGLAFATSRSWRVTSWTISFFLWTSPLGSGTYSSASRSNSVANVSDLPWRWVQKVQTEIMTQDFLLQQVTSKV